MTNALFRQTMLTRQMSSTKARLRTAAVLLLVTVGVGASCTAVTTPGGSAGPSLASQPSVSSPPSSIVAPVPSESAPPKADSPRIIEVPQGEARAEALNLVMRSNPAEWCVMESHVEPNPESFDLEALAAGLTGTQGVVADGIGYVGDLEAAIDGLGATEAVVSATGKEAWMLREVGEDAATVGVPMESIAAFRLSPRPLADGRTMWVLYGDLVAGRPCADSSATQTLG